MGALMTKEFRQAWRSFRLPALLLVLLFLAIMDPLVTKYMGEIFARFVEGVTIVLPPPSSTQAMGQFLGDVVELGVLVIIAITMGSVAGEKANGVASFIVTRPASRRAYVASKFLVLLGGLTAGIAGATSIASLYTVTLIGPVDGGRVISAAVSVWIYTAFIFCATFAASMAANGPLTAGGAGFAAFLVTALAGAVLGSASVGQYLPSALISNVNTFLSGSGDLEIAARILKPGAVAAVVSATLLALGFQSFKQQDLP